jgi:hypothetical protein
MNILVNYANKDYESARKWNTITGRLFGRFDLVHEYTPDDIDEEFKKRNSGILSYKRGNGLWLWKPYFIERTIRESNDGDVIFYFDSGSFFIRNPRILLDYISDSSPIFACDIPLIECNWTKPECFQAMDAWQFKSENQFWAGVQIIRVNDFTRKFYLELLNLCCNEELISPAGFGKMEIIDRKMGESFISHREDQSIFSLLCHKYGIRSHRDISHRGKDAKTYYSPYYLYREMPHKDDKYPTIIYLHKCNSLSRLFMVEIYKRLKISKFRSFWMKNMAKK